MKIRIAVAVVSFSALAACSTTPRPLVPDTSQGPASYVCYSSMTSTPEEIRAVAERQCGRWGYSVSAVIGQSWSPMKCGLLTPTVAAFQCGGGAPAMAPLAP